MKPEQTVSKKVPTEKQAYCLKVLAANMAISVESAIDRILTWRLVTGDPNRRRGLHAMRSCRVDYGWVTDVRGVDDKLKSLYLSESGRLALARYEIDHGPIRLYPHSLIESLTSPANDLEAIHEGVVDSTQRTTLVNARLGQGLFRKKVLAKWGDRCCVTGSKTVAAIRASHLKPWRNCDNKERLDPDNGLPLVATLDALFDTGLITFDTNGEMLISTQLNDNEREILGVDSLRLTQKPNAKTATFLEYHRENVFQK